MSFMRGPGFPDPLFEDIEELNQIVEEATERALVAPSAIPYLLEVAPIGALRVADPILGDLTVMAREAVAKVQARIDELRNPEGQGGVPLE